MTKCILIKHNPTRRNGYDSSNKKKDIRRDDLLNFGGERTCLNPLSDYFRNYCGCEFEMYVVRIIFVRMNQKTVLNYKENAYGIRKTLSSTERQDICYVYAHSREEGI